MNTELKERLDKVAYAQTFPFCYSCYKRAPSGRCVTCYSDDLMREFPGNGVEYGTEWVIEALVKEHCAPVNAEEYTLEMLNDCYGTVTICGYEYSQGDAYKDLDPVGFRCAVADEVSRLSDDEWVDIGSDYYSAHDLESMCDDLESSEVAS